MPNRINIPREFKLNNKKIIVEFDDAYCKDEDCLGMADFDLKLITLTSKVNNKRLPKAEVDKTFYHELMHLILDAANRHKLKWNEDFVDTVGLLLYEFERTKKF